MNAQLKSFTNEAHYTLVINAERGIAYDCGCKDRYYRGHTCKHMNEFNAEVQKAEAFLGLMAQYNVNEISSEKMDEMAAYYEAEEAARQNARCYYEMSLDPRFQ